MNFIQLSLFFFKNSNTKFVSNNKPEAIHYKNVSLKNIWIELAKNYFPENPEVLDFRVCWSNRHQTNCLASVNLTKKVVRVAPAMKLNECQEYLSPLLYHEMCHIIVGIKIVRGRRKMHTREFKSLERKNPEIQLLDNWIKLGGWKNAVRKSRYLKSKH